MAPIHAPHPAIRQADTRHLCGATRTVVGRAGSGNRKQQVATDGWSI